MDFGHWSLQYFTSMLICEQNSNMLDVTSNYFLRKRLPLSAQTSVKKGNLHENCELHAQFLHLVFLAFITFFYSIGRILVNNIYMVKFTSKGQKTLWSISSSQGLFIVPYDASLFYHRHLPPSHTHLNDFFSFLKDDWVVTLLSSYFSLK
jgi:hypothetical protein